MNSFFRKLRWLAQRHDREAELREEIQFHLDEDAEELQERGLTEDDARWAARREFGNVARVQEFARGEWGWTRSYEVQVAQNFERVRDGASVRLFRSYRSEYPDGGQLRDFIYVKDCVDVMLWLLATPGVCGLYNVGPEETAELMGLAREARQQVFELCQLHLQASFGGPRQ